MITKGFHSLCCLVIINAKVKFFPLNLLEMRGPARATNNTELSYKMNYYKHVNYACYFINITETLFEHNIK